MSKSLVGQVVSHEGRLYQILSDRGNMIKACSYNEDYYIETTIFVSKSTGKVVAKKEKRK
jgi:hypothetical protein